jgi:transposase
MLNKKRQRTESTESNQDDSTAQVEGHPDMQNRDQETRSRLRAVLMYEQGYSVEEVVAKAGCSRSSLLGWHKAYRERGVEGLHDQRQGGNNAKLTDEQLREMGTRLCGRSPRDVLGERTATPEGKLWTVEDLHNVIWQWYGVRYKSRTTYYNMLKSCVPPEWRLD